MKNESDSKTSRPVVTRAGWREEAFRLIGLRLERKTSNENGQSAVDCGSLWQRFETEKVAGRISGKLDEGVYAVYFDYEGDETAPFSYFIGCKVGDDEPVPDGLEELNVPAQEYRLAVAAGVMPGCMEEAWREIWKSGLNRAFGFDFELYGEDSHDWNDAEVDIFLSIKKPE